MESKDISAAQEPANTHSPSSVEAPAPSKAAQRKPKLSVEEQIEHLKSKGVKFELCDEEEAAQFLGAEGYYFKVCAYRVLFDKRVGGAHDGEYANLDFAHLKDLYETDALLRRTMLPLTLDIEQAAKNKLMAEVTRREDEDGYGIVADYTTSLNPQRRRYYENELATRSNDEYCGMLIEKYREEMPVWVFAETTTFGRLNDFYRFCAIRWDSKQMLEEHYWMKDVKALRNACAHGNCILNGINRKYKAAKEDSSRRALNVFLKTARISKQIRKSKLANRRIRGIAATLYLYAAMVTGINERKHGRNDLTMMKTRLNESASLYAKHNNISSFAKFFTTVIDNSNLLS